MFCKSCGKDIDIKSRVCPYCGEENDFLTGIDGSEPPDHIKEFQEEIGVVVNGSSSSGAGTDEDEYEDISSYHTESRSEDRYINSSSNRPRKRSNRSRNTYENTENASNSWKIMVAVCVIVIVISLIIILAKSCSSGGDAPENAAPSTTASTTLPSATETTEATTSVPATEKSISEYLNEATVNDESVMETAQGFYSNIQSACARGDYNTFKSYFSSSYTDAEIKQIYDENQAACAALAEFIPGYTQTISCDKYIYVYIAATTNSTTGDYVENTFVLSSDGTAFKLDKSDGAQEWLAQAPSLAG